MKPQNPLVFLGRVLASVRRDELVGRAAEIAFFMLFAVFPSLLVLVSLLGFFDLSQQTQRLAVLMETALPPEVAGPLLEEMARLTTRSTHGGLALGLGLALYAAYRAVASTVRGVNAAWSVRESRAWYLVLGRVVLLTFASVGGTVSLLLLLSLEDAVVAWMVGHGGLSERMAVWGLWLRWPMVIFLLHSLIALLYRSAAEYRRVSGLVTWGSAVAVLGLVLVTLGFRAYVGRVVDLGATYGSLGTVIGLALYFYFVAVAVLVGAEVDYHATHWRKRQD